MNVLEDYYNQICVSSKHPGFVYMRTGIIISKMDISQLNDESPSPVKQKIAIQQERHLDDASVLRDSLVAPEYSVAHELKMIVWKDGKREVDEVATFDFKRDISPLLDTCDRYDSDVMFAMYASEEPLVFC